MKQCSVEGCDKKNNANGLCAMHYQRVVRRGTTAEPPRPAPEERFWRKVNKTASCWNWTGAQDPLGYGSLRINKVAYRAHRYSYELCRGPIPDGLYIDHICHNPSCVNPDHLRPVTQKQNMENRQGPQRNNHSTGVLGVHFYKRRQQYMATVSHNNQSHFVGYFPTLEEASEAVRARRLELFTHNDLDRQQPGG